MYESCVAPHRVRFDISDESVVAICSCGRRAAALTTAGAAALMRGHLANTRDLHGAMNASRLLRTVA